MLDRNKKNFCGRYCGESHKFSSWI